MERDLTHGSIGRNILRFSLPYFLSYFLQTLYGMADLFIIGQFDSVSGTTAVSIGSQVMHMITVMIVGIAMGTTVMIGKSVGAKLKKRNIKDHRKYDYFIFRYFHRFNMYFIVFCKSNRRYYVYTNTSCCRNESLSYDLFCRNPFNYSI